MAVSAVAPWPTKGANTLMLAAVVPKAAVVNGWWERRGSKMSFLIGPIRDLGPGCSCGCLLTPETPLVLLEYKASSTVAEKGSWGVDTLVLTGMGVFSAQVNS